MLVLDFEVRKFSRRCAASQRELQPGEAFYSVLLPQGSDVIRLDYAAECWQGPPEEAIGWWRADVPDPQANRLDWAPHDVMLHYFEQVQGEPAKEEFCYVLALLMIRRRIFKLELTERDEQGRETLLVYCARNDTEYRIPAAIPDSARVQAIEQELAELLFARATRGPGLGDSTARLNGPSEGAEE
jgi:hypothetical protein